MDFDFSDDQEQLRDAVRKWVDKGYSFERRRATEKAGGFDRAAWNELAGRVKADAAPDIDSFRSKMGPVLTDFVAKTGPKGKALVDATVAAAKG